MTSERRAPLLAIVAAWAMLALATSAHADFMPPKTETLHSAVLGQKRKIDVYLPKPDKTDPKARYETIYVLDGDWNVDIVVEIVDFLQGVGFMPPVIVVGVPNHFDADGVNSRDHDLTPTVSDEQARSGGAADFLRFLKTELVPYVEARYPASGVRLVHGHSYGGLFLTYALINEPALFDGYLILDPALRWDHNLLDTILDEKLATLPSKGKAVYIAGREGRAFEGMGIAGVEPIFKRRAPADLHWKIVAYPDETHDSLKLKGTYDALKFAYAGYAQNEIGFVPDGGTLPSLV